MYTTLEFALDRCVERCQAGVGDRPYLTELLTLSKASPKAPPDEGVAPTIHYRPYYVAARFLAQNPDIRDLVEASGEAKFTLAQPRIDDLLALQQAYDLSFDLAVPPGFDAMRPEVTPTTAMAGYIAATATVPTTTW